MSLELNLDYPDSVTSDPGVIDTAALAGNTTINSLLHTGVVDTAALSTTARRGIEMLRAGVAVLQGNYAVRPVTRLKMRVNSVSTYGGSPLVHVGLSAVYSAIPDEENYAFGKATPSGNLNFAVIPECALNLKVGCDVYVDLTPVDAE